MAGSVHAITRAAARRGAALLDTALASAIDAGFSTTVLMDSAAPVVLLSPHLDDAILNCWSVLASGRDVRVVNVFAKPPSGGFVTHYDQICGAGESAAHVRARIDEDIEALATVGRIPVNLPFLDGQYRKLRRRPSLRELDAALARVASRASVVYAPACLGFEPQPDHALVRRLALRMADSGVSVRLYADVPYAVTFGWPHWATGASEDHRLDVDAFWRRLARDVPGIADLRAAQIVALDREEAARKLVAMQTYRTQFAALDGGPLGVLRNPLIHSYEVFWDIGAER